MFDGISAERDRLLDELASYRKKYEEIIDQRLGLRESTEKAPEMKPIVKRQPWAAVRNEYEAKKRAELWQSRIDAIEKMDKEKEQNVSSDAAS